MFDVLFLERPEPVPEGKNPGDQQADPHADEEEPPVSRQPEQQNQNHHHGNRQGDRASEEALLRLGIRLHALILKRPPSFVETPPATIETPPTMPK
jgi:hypothetical protein